MRTERRRSAQREWIVMAWFIAQSSVITAVALSQINTQIQSTAPVYNWNTRISPATPISARIRAEAELVQAYGSAAANVGRAREIRAVAIRQEIANSVEYMRAYWERRSINEAERMKRYVAPLQAKDIRDSKTWARLKDHPELNGPAIIEGTAQNFLLDRLSGGVLAYKFSLGATGPDPEMVKQLQLSPQVLHALNLRQDVPNGQRLVFRADEGTALQIDWWPFLIRGEEFAGQRGTFEKARQVAVAEAKTGVISNRALKDLMRVLDEIDGQFQTRYDRAFRLKTGHGNHGNFHHYLTGQRFIQSLASEIVRLQTTGDAKALDGGLKFKGDNLIELLTYMSRNGLDFGPARPGDEGAYHAVFRMMRDVYITVADEK